MPSSTGQENQDFPVPSRGNYSFVLFLDTHDSEMFGAAKALESLLVEHLAGQFSLQLIDIHGNAALLEQHRVIAVPTLDIWAPEGSRKRLVGDRDYAPYISALGLQAVGKRSLDSAMSTLRQADQSITQAASILKTEETYRKDVARMRRQNEQIIAWLKKIDESTTGKR